MPPLEPARQRELLGAAPVGRLATLRADGTPRLVPITFVLLEGMVCSAVDEVKPKRSSRLARLGSPLFTPPADAFALPDYAKIRA